MPTPIKGPRPVTPPIDMRDSQMAGPRSDRHRLIGERGRKPQRIPPACLRDESKLNRWDAESAAWEPRSGGRRRCGPDRLEVFQCRSRCVRLVASSFSEVRGWSHQSSESADAQAPSIIRSHRAAESPYLARPVPLERAEGGCCWHTLVGSTRSQDAVHLRL